MTTHPDNSSSDGRVIRRQLAEALSDAYKHGLDRIEQQQLAAQNYCALFPLHAATFEAADANLRAALQEFARTSDGIPGLHHARWSLLQESRRLVRPVATGPLLFSFICDGPVLDILEELVMEHSEVFGNILRYCEGFPGCEHVAKAIEYLRAHRIKSPYFFRDSRQLDPAAPPLHATALEIKRALRLRQRFVNFAAKPGAKLQDDFMRELRNPDSAARFDLAGYSFALSDGEHPIERERFWVRRLGDLHAARARREQRGRRLANQDPLGLRLVHAKNYGLIEAELQIRDNLPSDLQHGIFQPGARYRTLIRSSGSSSDPQPDYIPDARGLALKVFHSCNGRPAVDFKIPDGTYVPPGFATQDFLLVSHPTFFLKDARDFAIFRSFLEARPDGRAEKWALAASIATFASRRRREVAIFLRTLLRLTRNPLSLRYDSMTPIALGPKLAVKLSVQPSKATRTLLAKNGLWTTAADCWRSPADFLREALKRSLEPQPAPATLELELAIHRPLPNKSSVENATVDWDREGAPPVVAATLSIPMQNPASEERLRRAEQLDMTPWHALADHRPLGSLNRARLESLLASSSARARANGHIDTRDRA